MQDLDLKNNSYKLYYRPYPDWKLSCTEYSTKRIEEITIDMNDNLNDNTSRGLFIIDIISITICTIMYLCQGVNFVCDKGVVGAGLFSVAIAFFGFIISIPRLVIAFILKKDFEEVQEYN
mmetsp:Transcript_33295/g.24449  ORF Transcript_33295/g.24449 Transcript_33295/m.24449 type:complete len:120 (+) Transcript_33295:384-743(+)